MEYHYIAFATYIVPAARQDAKEVLRQMLVSTGETEAEARECIVDQIETLARPDLPDEDYDPENFYIVIRRLHLPTGQAADVVAEGERGWSD
jgi:hypothetical protein